MNFSLTDSYEANQSSSESETEKEMCEDNPAVNVREETPAPFKKLVKSNLNYNFHAEKLRGYFSLCQLMFIYISKRWLPKMRLTAPIELSFQNKLVDKILDNFEEIKEKTLKFVPKVVVVSRSLI